MRAILRPLSGAALLLCVACASAPLVLDEASDAELLDDLARRTFDWFWDTAEPATGLVPDRHPSRPFASVAAQGFALTAYGIGVERGYVSRAAAAERSATLLEELLALPQGDAAEGVAGHRGFFYHFLDLETGLRASRCELSSIDTALLLAGALFARGYFDTSAPYEDRVRAAATRLLERVDWAWLLQARPRSEGGPPLLSMGWRPERGRISHVYEGYDEAMILYVLALGADEDVPGEVWDAFTATYRWDEFQGHEYLQFPPHFGHQYSHAWIDFRGIADDHVRRTGVDYFENSRRATLAQRSYGIENPRGFRDYGPNVWGWTACDGPAAMEAGGVRFHRYWARGVGAPYVNDDGTLAPTAALASLPFAPEVVLALLRELRARYGDLVYRRYGFVDAFNPTFLHADAELEFGAVDPERGWFDDEQLGIDQGPILLMVENHESGLVWDVMRRDPVIRRGLERAGFRGGWLMEGAE